MNDFERMKAKQTLTTITGIIATEMGYANQTRICKSAEMVYSHIGTLNQTDFRRIKNFLNEETLSESKYERTL